MIWQSCQGASWLAVFAVGLFALAAPSAHAAEASYCVTCKNPDQVYLCQVTAGGKKPTDALKLYCVIRTAKEGQHSSCSAEKAKGPCNGIAKVYSYDGPMPDDIAASVQHYSDKVNDRIRKEQSAFEKPTGDQPKTLVELTGRAVSASRQGLRNARGRFGGSSEEVNQSLPEEPLSYDQTPVPLAAESAPALTPELSQPNRVQRASSAVGGFARKSYRCVASLFRKCRPEPVDDDTLR